MRLLRGFCAAGRHRLSQHNGQHQS
jgi:hypothetical protein